MVLKIPRLNFCVCDYKSGTGREQIIIKQHYFFGSVVLCLFCGKYHQIDIALLVHVVNTNIKLDLVNLSISLF